MSDFLLLGAVTNALNMASVSAEDAPKLKPYMKLAEQLGGFAGQITDSGLKRVRVDFQGHVASLNTRPLAAVVLEGLLSPLMSSVNMVNAPVVARERGIEIIESKNETAGDYTSLIRITVESEAGTRSVAGTLFANQKPRVVAVDATAVEAELGPHMLFLMNDDKPGFIGNLGSLLGSASVNIATFHLGRDAPGGNAIALIEVDDRVPDAVLARLRALPLVRQAKALNFPSMQRAQARAA
jgi:D-3-phosphoglycerate dehydrogenase